MISFLIQQLFDLSDISVMFSISFMFAIIQINQHIFMMTDNIGIFMLPILGPF